MRTSLQLALLLLLAAAPATQDAALFKDEFKGELKKDWSVWVRQNKDGYRVENGLHVKVESGSLWEKQNNAKNVLLAEVPQEDLSAEVTITSKPQDQAEQATILYLVDEDNYVKLCKEQMNGKQNVVLAREENGKGQFVAGKEAAGETLQLRLTRRGKEMIGEYSSDDGATWTEVGKCAPPIGDAVKFGLVAHGANTGDPREAKFENFKIVKVK